MRKLTLSFRNVYTIYELVFDNKPLSPKQFLDVLDIVMYTLLKEQIVCSQKENVTFIQRTSADLGSTIVLNPELLLKTLYYLDATAGTDDDGNVPFLLNGLYKEEVLRILFCLLQKKSLVCKRIRISSSFLETIYFSILSKLKYEKQDYKEEYYVLTYLQRLSMKDKTSQHKLYSVVGLCNITEVSYYSKYDHFDKEYCNKFRFIVTQSTSLAYPVDSFVFGIIQLNKTSVILYKDSECLFPIENE